VFFGGYATALAASFPAAFGLVFLARPEGRRSFRGLGGLEKSFCVAALGFAATVFVVLPDTSGFSWGPRFLLYVVPPAAVALSRLAGGAGGRVRNGLLALLLVMSVATQCIGLARLAATKGVRRDLVADLGSRAPAPVLTNKWYLAAYAAPLYSQRPFVLITEEGQLEDVAEALATRRVRRAYFVSELPTAPAERDDYVLGLTTTLGRDFDVADVGPAGGSGMPAPPIPPWYVWSLEIPSPPRDANIPD
jgi:hypothetical protein